MDGRGITVPALARSAAAAVGAVAGAAIAVPLAILLFTVLFIHVGVPLIEEIVSGGLTPDMSLIEKIIVGIFLLLAVTVLVIYLILALVAPVFVLVPLLSTAIALRLAGGGAILRSLLLMLAMIAAYTVVAVPAASAVEIDVQWWTWAAIVAFSAFGGRLVVELWRPDLAGTPQRFGNLWRRWKTLGLAWLITLVVATGVSLVLFVVKVG
ncbi:hypothetical protein E1264_28150 [Actinomadura sp. KC216]|uniref:hypothetical protein n=1 Tax=Actinomadura sp. KC216 TaxID=2530370 RepID=UPI00104F2708|nr:hypothetical protein [Actinomadura sp. KC216]TDB83517.1 hypothetical protein E1264_28150 [Actinomadura sp. KC216]